VIGFQQQTWILLFVSKGQELLADLTGSLVVTSTMVYIPESPEHRKEMRRIIEPAAQLVGVGVGSLHLGAACPSDRHQSRSQRDAEFEALREPVVRLRETGEDL
jgi:hypothetical protein